MKTALTDLIEELEKFKKLPRVDEATIEAAISFAEGRLSDEKQQLLAAYNAGNWLGHGRSYDSYFNETYNDTTKR